MSSPNALTEEQKRFYHENGYLIGMPPVYSPAEMRALNEGLAPLLALLRPGETTKDIREWHEESLYLHDICMNPRILDLVQGILGPDFYFWASNFFIKEARSPSTVGWHQDAYYWPMAPQGHTVTVWLAFDDVDAGNGAMKIIPGSHLGGVITHRRSTQTDSVLLLELERGSFREDTAVQFRLKAGEVSLHDDRAVHGSPANPSDRRRAGLTIRYTTTDVKNDMSVNPNFKAYLARGTDRFRLNPEGRKPTRAYGRPAFKAVSVEDTTTVR
jgi:ectoine hydroxylase-related dioxygenase (phytanoyl-CoA dioxygenase family)